MKKTIDITIDNKVYNVTIEGNVDKCTDFIYYTFRFDPDNWIAISKFDGKEWKIANKCINDNNLAALLGTLIDNEIK